MAGRSMSLEHQDALGGACSNSSNRLARTRLSSNSLIRTDSQVDLKFEVGFQATKHVHPALHLHERF